MPEKELSPQLNRREGVLSEIEIEKEKPVERLKEYLKNRSIELREEKIPVDDRGRINIDKFKEVYGRSVLASDKEWVERHKEIFKRAERAEKEKLLPGLKEKALKEKGLGEVFEMLLTAVLHKNLKEDFIIVRSSEYDDIKNGVDTIILDRKMGNIVCAIDEIGRIKGPRYEEKKQKILEKNYKGGGFLKYGIHFEKKKEGMELKRGLVDNVPLFYCAFSENKIKSTLENFQFFQESSLAEQELFNSFFKLCLEQIDYLLKNRNLYSKLKERLELFKESMEALREKIEKT